MPCLHTYTYDLFIMFASLNLPAPLGQGVYRIHVDVSIGSLLRSALAFEFDYIQIPIGPAIAQSVIPDFLYASQSGKNYLTITLTNFPILSNLSNVNAVSAKIDGGEVMHASRILGSTRMITRIVIRIVPSPAIAPGSTVTLEVFHSSFSADKAARVSMLVHENKQARLLSMTPTEGRADEEHLINFQVEHLSVQGLTATFRIGDEEGELEIDRVQESVCVIIATCASSSVVLRTPAVNPTGVNSGGNLQISLCADERCVEGVFKYLPRGSFRVSAVFPEVAWTNKPTTVSIFLDNFPDIIPDVFLEHVPLQVLASYHSSSTLTVVKAVVPEELPAGSLSGRVYAAGSDQVAIFSMLVYFPDPVISPSQGDIDGGTPVSVVLGVRARRTQSQTSDALTHAGVTSDFRIFDDEIFRGWLPGLACAVRCFLLFHRP